MHRVGSRRGALVGIKRVREAGARLTTPFFFVYSSLFVFLRRIENRTEHLRIVACHLTHHPCASKRTEFFRLGLLLVPCHSSLRSPNTLINFPRALNAFSLNPNNLCADVSFMKNKSGNCQGVSSELLRFRKWLRDSRRIALIEEGVWIVLGGQSG